jgi:hypothetical protein
LANDSRMALKKNNRTGRVYCVHNLEIFDSVYQTTLAAERQPERRKQREPSIIWLIGYSRLRLQRGSPSASDTNPSNRIFAIPGGRAREGTRTRGQNKKASRGLGKSRRAGLRRRGTRTRRRQSIQPRALAFSAS